MELDRMTMELLRPAAEALRRALQRMDEEDVPAGLRTLAESSARRLPPPILKRALTELDGSSWLRAETAAEGGLEPESAAGLFVQRPQGWQARLDELVGHAADRRSERSRAELENRLSQAMTRIAELEEAVRSGSEDVAVAERRVRDRLQEQIRAAERGRKAAEDRAREEARSAAGLASRTERLEAELAAAEERLEAVRQMLEKERRANAAPGEDVPARGWFPDDPRAMAEELDRVFVALRRPPGVDREDGLAAPPLRLPAGMRPDRMEVVHWLMKHPLQWLIDGYNLAFHVADEPDSATRTRLAAAAGRLAALAAAGSMVMVVFDSSVDMSSLPADRRVRVVYVHSADDWIVEHAGAGTVVVSSDRQVREQAEEAGAVGIWSEALAGWIEAGTPRGG